MVKIETGKYYRTRNGQKYGPIAIDPHCQNLCGVEGGSLSEYYIDRASKRSVGVHWDDLVAEWLDWRDLKPGDRIRIVKNDDNDELEGKKATFVCFDEDGDAFFELDASYDGYTCDGRFTSSRRLYIFEDDIKSGETIIEPAPAKPATEYGWNEWAGGECLVLGDTVIEIERRDGMQFSREARHLYWNRDGALYDIIRYRVIEPAQEPAWKRAKVGDFVRVEGDSAHPDGTYRVDFIDDESRRLRIRSGDCWLDNGAVKEIVPDPAKAAAQPYESPFDIAVDAFFDALTPADKGPATITLDAADRERAYRLAVTGEHAKLAALLGVEL